MCRFGDWSFSAPAMLFKSIFEVFRADYRFLQRGSAIRLLPLSLGCKGVFVRKLHFGRPQQHGRRRKGPVPRGSKTTHPESLVLRGIRCVVLETHPFRRRPCCLGALKSIFGGFRADYRFLQRGFATRQLSLSLDDKGVSHRDRGGEGRRGEAGEAGQR